MSKIVVFIVVALIVVGIMTSLGFADEMVWAPAVLVGGGFGSQA